MLICIAGMRLKARVDTNHTEIVEGLRKAGRSVKNLHTVGHGFPDICVGHHGINFLLEIKSEKGKLSPDQKALIAEWGGTIIVVWNLQEALNATR